jgi:hypothetical protein
VHTRTTHLPYGRRLEAAHWATGPPRRMDLIVPLALRDRSGPTRITLTSRGTTLMDSTALVGDVLRTSELCCYRPPLTLAAESNGNEMPREAQGLGHMSGARRFLSPYSDIVPT